MQKLDFDPAKSEHEFKSNYRLHDLAELTGKDLLVQWNIRFKSFGEDRRHEKIWEQGQDKPDLIINYNGKSALLDWKGKHSKGWVVNQRAIKSYEEWQKELNMPVIICFFAFDDMNMVKDRRFAIVNVHKYIESKNKQWDKNKTVEFIADLPVFNKKNLLDLIFTTTS